MMRAAKDWPIPEMDISSAFVAVFIGIFVVSALVVVVDEQAVVDRVANVVADVEEARKSVVFVGAESVEEVSASAGTDSFELSCDSMLCSPGKGGTVKPIARNTAAVNDSSPNAAKQ